MSTLADSAMPLSRAQVCGERTLMPCTGQRDALLKYISHIRFAVWLLLWQRHSACEDLCIRNTAGARCLSLMCCAIAASQSSPPAAYSMLPSQMAHIAA